MLALAGECDVLPPLSTPPQWAAAPAPDASKVQDLRNQTEDLLHRISKLAASMASVPGPSQDELGKLQTVAFQEDLHQITLELRAVRYPAELTSWINDLRVLAAHATSCFDDGIGDLQRLYRMQPGGRGYQSCLTKVRRGMADIKKDLTEILDYFDNYLASMAQTPSEVISSAPSTRIIQFPTQPAELVAQGRREGLREAARIVWAVAAHPADSARHLDAELVQAIAEHITAEIYVHIGDATTPEESDEDQGLAEVRGTTGGNTDRRYGT